MTLLFIDGPLQCVYFRGLVSTAAAHYGRAAATTERGGGRGRIQIPGTAPAGYALDTGNNAEQAYIGGINIQI